MALAERAPRQQAKGKSRPRVAPPTPARSLWRRFKSQADELGIALYPWQEEAARFLYAVGRGEAWAYPEFAAIVSRQEGKTTLLEPLIVDRLRAGRRIMHAAQNRELPRETHDVVAQHLIKHYPGLLPKRRGIRYGAGQEEIRLTTGGHYRIVAPTKGGARGPANDDVIVDEVRELDDYDFIAAAEPTLSARPNPQLIYLSNAGDESSVVLNSLRDRALAGDPSLAYLEWSAHPDRATDDRAGWLEANPSVGHNAAKMAYLERKFESYRLAGTLAIFEVEHLCRWVTTTKPRILDEATWLAGARTDPGAARRPVMGIGLDQAGRRASAVIAWQMAGTAGHYGLEVIADITGDPIDIDAFGPELRRAAIALGVRRVIHDPYSEHLARHLRGSAAMNGRDYVNASGRFVVLAKEGKLHWRDPAGAITADLRHTTAKHVGPEVFMAVPSGEDPVTAVMAAIRAIGAAYQPPSIAAPRIF